MFVSNGDVFKLGIPTTITITPIEITGGDRHELSFGRRAKGTSAFRLVLFGGVVLAAACNTRRGLNFATAGEDVEAELHELSRARRCRGADWRWIGAGVEYQHRWVPDAIGNGGVSAEFNEDDLGGGTFRVRFIVSF